MAEKEIHNNQAAVKAGGMNIFLQIVDIGDKIVQARVAQGNIVSRNRILGGAIEIIDLILKYEFKIGRMREMNILRDVIQDIINGTGLYDCSLESLEKYCSPFALLARKPV